MAKYLYIDLPIHKHNGFKDLTALKIGDEIEVCLYEFSPNEMNKVDEFLQSLECRCVRLNAKIELQFHSGNSHLGYQTFKLIKQ